MVISVAALRTFVAVAEVGNITEAAETLGRTPSAISMALKQLEDHLGRPLFEGDRKSNLTALGTYVLDKARREVEHYGQTIGSIESYARNEIGQVFVACVPSFATLMMPDVIKGFLASFPAIELDVRDMDSQSVVQAVEQGRIEVGIASVPASRIGPNIIPLMADPIGVICRADHALAALGRPVTWSDLDGHTFMANGICKLITAPAMRGVLERSTLMVRNTTSLIALVTEGVGITILPQLSIPAGNDQLRFLPIQGVTELRHLYVVTRANSAPSPAVEAFIAALLAMVTERGWGQSRAAAE
jgi:LysR family transcriptional regulator, carnitine catabolism transcriptional activator